MVVGRAIPRPQAAASASPLKLTALQHAALRRELAVEAEGTAGELELSLTVQFVRVTSPAA